MNNQENGRLGRIMYAIYSRIDLSQNIAQAQEAAQKIPEGISQLWAALFVTVILVFSCITFYYVDYVPSLHFGKWLADSLLIAGAIGLVFSHSFALVPTSTELVGPMLHGRVWFLTLLSNAAIVFDLITDEPMISAMVDARLDGVVLVNDLAHPLIVVAIKLFFVVTTSLFVQTVAIALMAMEVELFKSIWSQRGQWRRMAPRGGFNATR